MFAFMCNFYPAYKVSDWLKTPVKTFFAMHREAMKIEARRYHELLDISLAPKMNLDYYFDVQRRYRSILEPEIKKLPERPGGPILEAGSKDAMNVMKDVAFAVKRNFGYGR